MHCNFKTKWNYTHIHMHTHTHTYTHFLLFFSFEIKTLYNYLVYLFICLFIYLLIFVRVDARFMERGGGEGGGGKHPLTQASGCNFPLFLVYPVDMPEKYLGRPKHLFVPTSLYAQKSGILCPRLFVPKRVVFCAHVSLCLKEWYFVPTSLCA